MIGSRSAYLISLAAVVALSMSEGAAAVNISGLVTDSAGVPIPDAAIKPEATGTAATSGADRRFTLTGATPILAKDPIPRSPPSIKGRCTCPCRNPRR